MTTHLVIKDAAPLKKYESAISACDLVRISVKEMVLYENERGAEDEEEIEEMRNAFFKWKAENIFPIPLENSLPHTWPTCEPCRKILAERREKMQKPRIEKGERVNLGRSLRIEQILICAM